MEKKVVFQLTEKLEHTYCTFYFDNFFNCPFWFDKDTYTVGILGVNKKQMPQMKDYKQMKSHNVYLKYSYNVVSCKWCNNKYVLLLARIIETMGMCSTI